MLAFFLIFSGKTQKAIELIKRAFRLNPVPPPSYFLILGIAYRIDGRYLEAIEAYKKAIIISPDYLAAYFGMAACYSLLEQKEKARETVSEILRIDPNYSIEIMAKTIPFKQKIDLDNLLEAMRQAGLPEHPPKE
jgi:adenylate cyclase